MFALCGQVSSLWYWQLLLELLLWVLLGMLSLPGRFRYTRAGIVSSAKDRSLEASAQRHMDEGLPIMRHIRAARLSVASVPPMHMCGNTFCRAQASRGESM